MRGLRGWLSPTLAFFSPFLNLRMQILFLFFLNPIKCVALSSIAWDEPHAFSFLITEIQKPNFTFCSYDQNLAPPYIQMKGTEKFSRMVILDLFFGIRSDFLIHGLIQDIEKMRNENGLYCFFDEKDMLPPDTDSTALANTLLAKAGNKSCSILRSLETILSNANHEGIIEVYFDPLRKGRIDPVVCANALYFINFFGKGLEAKTTEEFVFNTLTLDCYSDRMRYYSSEDTFLYVISRLLDFPSLRDRFIQPLCDRLKKRIRMDGNALDLAMRIMCAKKLGWSVEEEEKKLASLQEADGGWPICVFFKNGSSDQFWGSRAIATAFAIRALTDTSSDLIGKN